MSHRLTIHDQLVINLCGWLTLAWSSDPNLELVIGQLRRALPSVNHVNPVMGQLMAAATSVLDRIAHPDVGLRNLHAVSEELELRQALQAIFALRAAQAAAAIWPEENSQPNTHDTTGEPAHAAE